MTQFSVTVDPGIKIQDVAILGWTESDYNNLDVLTVANASFVEKMEYVTTNSDGNKYAFNYAGLAAKDVFTKIYTCAVITDTEGNVYYGGVVVYSPERYIYINAGKEGSNAELARRLAIYAYAAKNYFY